MRHEVVQTRELDSPEYARNSPEPLLLLQGGALQPARPDRRDGTATAQLVYGANMDDLGDHRPGMEAAKARGVRAPLIEAELWKEEIRALSRELGLPTWDKPSFACLSSRFQYGDAITAEKLRQIDAAEAFVREPRLPPVPRAPPRPAGAPRAAAGGDGAALARTGATRRSYALPRARLSLRDARPAGLPQRQRQRGPQVDREKVRAAARGGRGGRARRPSRRWPGCARCPSTTSASPASTCIARCATACRRPSSARARPPSRWWPSSSAWPSTTTTCWPRARSPAVVDGPARERPAVPRARGRAPGRGQARRARGGRAHRGGERGHLRPAGGRGGRGDRGGHGQPRRARLRLRRGRAAPPASRTSTGSTRPTRSSRWRAWRARCRA